MTLEIEKDKYLNCWIVWECHQNYRVDIFHAKTKKECVEYVRKNCKNEDNPTEI